MLRKINFRGLKGQFDVKKANFRGLISKIGYLMPILTSVTHPWPIIMVSTMRIVSQGILEGFYCSRS